MEIAKIKIPAEAIKIEIKNEIQKTCGRAFLYLIRNGLHDRPYGYIEDVFVEEDSRGQGLGDKLLENIIATAKENNCYKLVGTSRVARAQVHEWYERLGFTKYGFEFRMDL